MRQITHWRQFRHARPAFQGVHVALQLVYFLRVAFIIAQLEQAGFAVFQ